MHRTSWVFVIESRNPGDMVVAATLDRDAQAKAFSDSVVGDPSKAFPLTSTGGSSASPSDSGVSDPSRRLYAVPEAARTRVWFGFDSPHATVMAPFYATQRIVPPSWSWGVQCKMSRTSAFW